DPEKEKDKGSAASILQPVKNKLGLGDEKKPGIGGFPSAAVAVKPAAPAAKPEIKTEAAQGAPRDWSKMLARVRTDVERICNFLEALAKHPRGLQKYHE